MFFAAGAPPTINFSWLTLLTLLLILAASAGVFWMLVRRWTTQRHWSALAEWARGHQFRLHPRITATVPEALITPLHPLNPEARIALVEPGTTVLEMETDTTPGSRSPENPTRWHLLVREIESAWPPTGLRPAAHRASLIDLFSLSSFPSLIPPERFVVFASQPGAAKTLANSPARALLPSDVGLLLCEQYLILDFTSRPFDPIEFDRMLSLADQLMSYLPAPTHEPNNERH